MYGCLFGLFITGTKIIRAKLHNTCSTSTGIITIFFSKYSPDMIITTKFIRIYEGHYNINNVLFYTLKLINFSY